MLKVLLIFILLSVQPLFFISKLKQRFEVMLPVCCMSDILVILAFGMVFKNLTAGVIAVFILAATSLIAAVYFERKDLAGFFSKVATPGFYAWCAGYCLMWAFSYKQFFSIWDGFMHWGVFVKQMFFYNKLYTEPDIQVLMHKAYTPSIPLFEYMFIKIWGHYSEPVMFAAYKVLLYACLLPFIKIFSKKETFKAIILSFTAYFSLFIWTKIDNATFTIDVDAHLSVLFALYIFLTVFDKGNPLRLINCAITGIVLTLTKATGFEFAMVGMGIYVLTEFIDLKSVHFNKLSVVGFIKKMCVFVIWLLPLLSYFLWNSYTKLLSSELSGITSIGSLIQWLTLNGSEIKSNIFSASVYLWGTMPLTSGLIPIYNPFLVIAFIVIMYCFKKAEKDRRLTDIYSVLMIIIPLGYLVYSFSLTVVQLMSNSLITRDGGDGVNSFNRYLATYVAGMYLLLLSIAFRISSKTHNKNSRTRSFVAIVSSFWVIMLLPSSVFQYLAPLGTDGYDASEYKNYIRYVQKNQNFSSVINEKNNAKVYLVISDSKINEHELERLFWKMQYWLKPIESNTFVLQNPLEPEEPEEPFIPVKGFYDGTEWSLLLLERGYTHVLINNADNNFKERFYKMFDCSYEQIKADTLYEIVQNDSEELPVKLVPLDVSIYSD